MFEMSTTEGSAELMSNDSGWLPAQLELGPGGTEQTPKDRVSSQQYLAVPVLCKPNPTHFVRVFEKHYSGGEGKKGGFVVVNLSSLNFLRSYNVFILIRGIQFCRLEFR